MMKVLKVKCYKEKDYNSVMVIDEAFNVYDLIARVKMKVLIEDEKSNNMEEKEIVFYIAFWGNELKLIGKDLVYVNINEKSEKRGDVK